jgi:hypothetical protein
MLGFGPLAGEKATDIHRYNASGQLVSGLPGESFTDSADAFAMARSGRVTTIVPRRLPGRRPTATSRTGGSRRPASAASAARWTSRRAPAASSC